MAKMPTMVRIGPFDYSVSPVAQFDPDNILGQCVYADLEIEILDGMAPQRTAEVLIHEILHACWDACGLEHEQHYKEEVVISALGIQLAQVVRDNPQLITWLSKQLKQ